MRSKFILVRSICLVLFSSAILRDLPAHSAARPISFHYSGAPANYRVSTAKVLRKDTAGSTSCNIVWFKEKILMWDAHRCWNPSWTRLCQRCRRRDGGNCVGFHNKSPRHRTDCSGQRERERYNYNQLFCILIKLFFIVRLMHVCVCVCVLTTKTSLWFWFGKLPPGPGSLYSNNLAFYSDPDTEGCSWPHLQRDRQSFSRLWGWRFMRLQLSDRWDTRLSYSTFWRLQKFSILTSCWNCVFFQRCFETFIKTIQHELKQKNKQ